MRPLPKFSRVLHCAHPRAVCSGNVLRVDTVSTLGFSAEDVRTAFVRCDRNGDGKLDIYEIARAFRAIGLTKRAGEKSDMDKAMLCVGRTAAFGPAGATLGSPPPFPIRLSCYVH